MIETRIIRFVCRSITVVMFLNLYIERSKLVLYKEPAVISLSDIDLYTYIKLEFIDGFAGFRFVFYMVHVGL